METAACHALEGYTAAVGEARLVTIAVGACQPDRHPPQSISICSRVWLQTRTLLLDQV